MWVINAIASYDKDVVDDESMAKMSGGDVDVESSLNSQNTLGNRNRNSSYQRKMWQNRVGVQNE